MSISSVVKTITLHLALLTATTFHLFLSNKNSDSRVISFDSKNPKHDITRSAS